MIEQAETLVSCREAITAAVAKEVTKAEIQELMRRTLPIKPRHPGDKAVTNPADYRVWAIITLRKLDLSGSAMRETRDMVIDRLNLLATSSTDAEVIAEAKAALTVMKK